MATAKPWQLMRTLKTLKIAPPRKRFTGIANYQATTKELDDDQQPQAQQAEGQDESQAQNEEEPQATTLPLPQEDYDDITTPLQAPTQQSLKTSTVDEDNEERELDPYEFWKTNL